MNNYNETILNDGRKLDYLCKITTADNVILDITAGYIFNIDIQQSCDENDDIAIGTFNASRLNIKLFTDLEFEAGNKIQIYVRTYNNVEFSEYFCIFTGFISRTNKKMTTLSITAYDLAYDLGNTSYQSRKEISETLEYNLTTILADVIELAKQDYDITINLARTDLIQSNFIIPSVFLRRQQLSIRQIIGQIAGTQGAFAFFNNDNELDFYHYENLGTSLTLDNQIETQTLNKDSIKLNKINLFNYVDTFSVGEAADFSTLQVTNLFGTQEVAENLYYKFSNFEYFKGTVNVKGTGLIRIGELINVTEYYTNEIKQIIASNINYTIVDSSFDAEIISTGRTATSSTITTTSIPTTDFPSEEEQLNYAILEYKNEDLINFTSSWETVAELDFATFKDIFVLTNIFVNYNVTVAGLFEFRILLDDVVYSKPSVYYKTSEIDWDSINIILSLAEYGALLSHNFALQIRSLNGSANIPLYYLTITLSGQSLVDGELFYGQDTDYFERFTPIRINPQIITIDNFIEDLNREILIPNNVKLNEIFTPIQINSQVVRINELTENVDLEKFQL